MTEPDLSHWPDAWPWSGRGGSVAGSGAMVATTDRHATRVGVEILRGGGNAVDAAVGVTFALAVVNPEAGNLGGGGFTLVRSADGSLHALDHRSTAPARASRDMFIDARGERTEAAESGPAAAAVPGTVRGVWELHRRLGRLPWAGLVEPAIELARGFRVEERFVRSFPPHIVEGLRRFPESARIFLPDGRPPAPGTTFRQPDLARTLERIRDDGADGFYRGETGRRIAAEMKRGGGLITGYDLAGYRAVWRRPVLFEYRGHTVVSMPPSSSGGATLAGTALILAAFDLGGLAWHGARHVHLLAEAWRRAFADRNHYLADPDFAPVPMDSLLDPAYGAARARSVDLGRATPSEGVAPGLEAWSGGDHTTHVSIVDADGSAVSSTTTLNTWYGSKLVVPGTGVLLNNEMDDFTARPGVPNHFGLLQGPANAIEPGKRPLSAMAPALVLDPRDRLLLVVGTPGGATIITQVFQVVSNVLDHGMDLATAVAAPRVHHQHLPDRIEVEPGGLPDTVAEALRAKGHQVEERGEAWGDVQAIAVSDDGGLEGVADPRRGGVASGF